MPAERIERMILLIRRQRVILDSDIASLYGVQTKVLIQAIRRNIDRFPIDFMFQLTEMESQHLRSQFVTSRWGGRRHRPYVFTEQGIAMLSSVLRSRRAILVNIAIMRTFVQLRQMLLSHEELKQKLQELEEKYDGQFARVFDAIRSLMAKPDVPPKSRIGFRTNAED